MKCVNDRGSVLMEFVIVLPIYLILLGFVFMLGEMSLHAVHLAASGDRTLAVTQGGMTEDGRWFSNDGWTLGHVEGEIAKAISPYSNRVDVALKYSADEGGEAKVSRFRRETAGMVADSNFKGSWSWIVASTLKDDYALTPWTRGMVRTWANLEKMVRMTEPPKSLGSDTVLAKLFSGASLGRVSMVSKDLNRRNEKTYAYYTLMRNDKGRSSYRSWGDGGLVDKDASWYNFVYAEGFLGSKIGSDGMRDPEYGMGNNAPATCSRDVYKRYSRFEKDFSE